MFENISALLLLAILLPVIILYMLRPKSRTLRIPSLILLLPEAKKRSLRSLIKKLVRDPLLFIQLLIITVLVLSIADPYYPGNARAEHIMIVLDASASMAATDVVPDRFVQAVDIAKKYIEDSDRTSVILAGSTPALLLKDSDKKRAIDAIQRLSPKATGTDLNDAMLLAVELMGNEKGKLVIISDFSGQDITRALKTVEAKSIDAEYRQVGRAGSNVGITGAAIDGRDLGFTVKNYNDAAKDVHINIVHGDLARTVDRTIKQKSVEFFLVPNISGGTTRVMLEPEDELSIDNTLYVSTPGSVSRRVLLLGDSAGKRNPLNIAFNSIPDLEVHDVPFERAPHDMEYGMIVVHDYTANSPLPGTMDDLQRYVEGGGTLVVVADTDLQSMDTKGLLPVNVSGMAVPSRFKVRNAGPAEDIDLGISGYLKAALKDGAVELASAGEGTVLAYWNVGKGKVVYLGINDKWGDFHLRTSYPIFWFKLLKFAAPDELNFKTGTLLPLGKEERVDGPGSSVRTGILYLDETGFYKIGDKTIASNLLDEKESDISVKKLDLEEQGEVDSKNAEKMHINTMLSILAVILIALELYYLRYRGDI